MVPDGVVNAVVDVASAGEEEWLCAFTTPLRLSTFGCPPLESAGGRVFCVGAGGKEAAVEAAASRGSLGGCVDVASLGSAGGLVSIVRGKAVAGTAGAGTGDGWAAKAFV